VLRLLLQKGPDSQAKTGVSALPLCMWGTLRSCPLLICFTPALPHHLSLAAGWTNAARCCQGQSHQRGVSAARRGNGTHTLLHLKPTHTTHSYPLTPLNPHRPSHDVPVSAPPRPLALPHTPFTQLPSFPADRCNLCTMHLGPFLQRLIDAALRGNVKAVRTLLSGSAGSVAGFINGSKKVRETLAFLLLLPLLLLLCCYWSCCPSESFF
jgi:hypothetical protein